MNEPIHSIQFALALKNEPARLFIYWGCSSHKLILRYNENTTLLLRLQNIV